jgi:hypothetical protein
LYAYLGCPQFRASVITALMNWLVRIENRHALSRSALRTGPTWRSLTTPRQDSHGGEVKKLD